MAVTHPDFFFVHFPRTGGTSLSEWLIFNIPQTEMIGRLEGMPPFGDFDWWSGYHKHIATWDCEEEYNLKDKFVFAVIRNPYDWYVSRWKHSHYHMPFKDFVMAPLDFSMPKALQGLQPFVENKPSIGSMTLRFFAIFCKREDDKWLCLIDHFLRYEEGYPEAVEAMFGKHLFPLTAQQKTALNNLPRYLSSDHAYYHEYYDDEARGHVRHQDRVIFREFGFEF